MTGEAAIRIHKQSVVRKSIYGRHVLHVGPDSHRPHLSVRRSLHRHTGRDHGLCVCAGNPEHQLADFSSTVTSATKGTFGILGNIVNTLYIVVITLLIATPIGIGAAIYLNEYAGRGVW